MSSLFSKTVEKNHNTISWLDEKKKYFNQHINFLIHDQLKIWGNFSEIIS